MGKPTALAVRGASRSPKIKVALQPISLPLPLRHAARMPLTPATRPLKSISSVDQRPADGSRARSEIYHVGHFPYFRNAGQFEKAST